MMHPQRVVSTWDMLSLNARPFMDAVATCERVRMLVEEDLKTTGQYGDNPVSDDINRRAKRHLNSLIDSFEKMHLPVSLQHVKRCLADMKRAKVSYRDLGNMNKETYNRFMDEMEGKVFLFSSDDEPLYYKGSDKSPFGSHVETAFPDCAEDITEASRCLGVSRYTACAFHLMRAMEASVQAMSITLGISNTERSWGPLLSDMHSKIERLPKGEERDNWSQSHSHLYHVKQTWRNSTMHPKKTYTPEQAKSVFLAVKSFMTHLAPLVSAQS